MDINKIPDEARLIGLTGMAKVTDHPKGTVWIKIHHAGNMGSGIDNVSENLYRAWGVTVEELREMSSDYKENGSPDYYWTGDYRIKV